MTQLLPSRSQIHETFFSLMAQSTRQWRRLLDRELQSLDLGLTEATWLALLHLARAPEPLRQKDLALSMSLDSSSVVRLLDTLESSGLVERMEHADRRAKTIGLTSRGQDIVAQVEVIARDARKRILAVASDDELESAFRVMARISEALQQPALESAA